MEIGPFRLNRWLETPGLGIGKTTHPRSHFNIEGSSNPPKAITRRRLRKSQSKPTNSAQLYLERLQFYKAFLAELASLHYIGLGKPLIKRS